MRLTGGFDRGRRLRAPRGPATRPTASRVREALFNILGPPSGGAVLDLYAGTGALGLEALSRGAPRAVFVERDGRAVAALQRNLRELGLEARARVLPVSAHAALRLLEAEGVRFEWVFVDPPYASSEAERTLGQLNAGTLLASGAVVAVEHDKRRVPADAVACLYLTDRRFYGDTGLSFYRRETRLQ